MTLDSFPLGPEMFEKWWPKHGFRVWRIVFTLVILVFLGGVLYAAVSGAQWARRELGGSQAEVSGGASRNPRQPSISVIPIQQITGQTFQNTTVAVDNKWFHDCTFENVTLVWEGGFFQWENSTFKGTHRIVSHNSTIVGTIDILKGLGFLETQFAADWKHFPSKQK